MAAANQAVGGQGDGVCVEGPQRESRVDEQQIRAVDLLRQSSEATKKDGEEQRRRQWLNDGPQRAEYGLFVADFDIAPDEEVQQLAVAPELRQVHALPRSRRLDSQFSLNRCCH